MDIFNFHSKFGNKIFIIKNSFNIAISPPLKIIDPLVRKSCKCAIQYDNGEYKKGRDTWTLDIVSYPSNYFRLFKGWLPLSFNNNELGETRYEDGVPTDSTIPADPDGTPGGPNDLPPKNMKEMKESLFPENREKSETSESTTTEDEEWAIDLWNKTNEEITDFQEFYQLLKSRWLYVGTSAFDTAVADKSTPPATPPQLRKHWENMLVEFTKLDKRFPEFPIHPTDKLGAILVYYCDLINTFLVYNKSQGMLTGMITSELKKELYSMAAICLRVIMSFPKSGRLEFNQDAADEFIKNGLE